jgi:hypothetical protein
LLAVAVAAKQLAVAVAPGVCYKDLPLFLPALYIHLLLDLAGLGHPVVVVILQDPVLLVVIVNIPLLLLMVVVVVEITTMHHMMPNQEDLAAALVLLHMAVVQALRDKATLVEVLVIILILGPVAVVLDTLVVILHLVYQEREAAVSLVVSPVQ